VKSYVQRQFKKLLEGNVNIQDFVIAKEYRGRDYYSPGASVPALHLTRWAFPSLPLPLFHSYLITQRFIESYTPVCAKS